MFNYKIHTYNDVYKKVSIAERVLIRASSDNDPVMDYAILANAINWRQYILPKNSGRQYVLEIGAGTGRWLDAISHYYANLLSKKIFYTIIDPSENSQCEFASKHRSQITIERALQSRVQDARKLPIDKFDLATCMHSLYAIPYNDLGSTIKTTLSSIRRGGFLIIAIAHRDSFYGQASQNVVGGAPLTSAEDVLEFLVDEKLRFSISTIQYDQIYNIIERDEIQRFVFDEAIGNSYPKKEKIRNSAIDIETNRWLQGFNDGQNFAFPQKTAVFFIGKE